MLQAAGNPNFPWKPGWPTGPSSAAVLSLQSCLWSGVPLCPAVETLVSGHHPVQPDLVLTAVIGQFLISASGTKHLVCFLFTIMSWKEIPVFICQLAHIGRQKQCLAMNKICLPFYCFKLSLLIAETVLFMTTIIIGFVTISICTWKILILLHIKKFHREKMGRQFKLQQ